MSVANRRAAIETYYESIDDEDFDRMASVVADDVTYVTAHGEMHGVDEMLEYYTENRSVTDTVHDVVREVRDGDVWVCEGVVTGEYVDGGSFDGGYVGIFEFESDSATVEELSVYTRSVF
ncbi:nuclear transport factor 2 family protein [Halorussus salinisoli]|uniref:nuclear transport factor 2 family protein n=1 Tax=Halorussus salinisoli TaxID=2558242 RepID=UPI0010C209E6|nr:nuclear transport factor 2 family protein [Halorussus salinisoli]